MSDRTLSALSTAMQHCDTPAFWIDAFCIPHDQPQKRITLESMGFIYSQASEVIVSLDSSTGLVLKRMSCDGEIDDAMLEHLEQDAWVESVWTYQEVVNSHKLKFAPRNWMGEWFSIWSSPWTKDNMIAAGPFFSGLGASLQRCKNRHGIKDLDIFSRYPRLDALEETLSDWMMAEYVERSALQVMANMDRRRATESKYRFYSMIGSVTKDPCQRQPAVTLSELAETFMRICELKDDFSFIFSAAPRSDDPMKPWRPQAGFLPSIISWHCTGSAQNGRYDSMGFWLKDMMCVTPSSWVNEKGNNFLLSCVRSLGRDTTEDNKEAITAGTLDILRRMGYTGEDSFIITQHGLFYPQQAPSPSERSALTILVSTQVLWTFGAPGLAMVGTPSGSKFILGVFVGVVLHTGQEVRDYLIGPGDHSVTIANYDSIGSSSSVKTLG